MEKEEKLSIKYKNLLRLIAEESGSMSTRRLINMVKPSYYVYIVPGLRASDFIKDDLEKLEELGYLSQQKGICKLTEKAWKYLKTN